MQAPIDTLPLFPLLDRKLIDLLRSLSSAEWNAPTRARLWTVKDIAAHLLDGNIRTLSISRDRYFGESPGAVNAYADLVAFLNQLNADWVKAARRISPAVLIDLLETTGHEYYEHLCELDPSQPAVFSVAWAGQDTSPNWFHIAREYTEKWHHQQQIREATGKPGIESRALYYPVLDTFLQALPHHYRNVQAAEGTVISITISGDAGGTWFILRNNTGWELSITARTPAATITIPDADAWKLFTKGLPAAAAASLVSSQGPMQLTQPILSLVAVMA